MHTREREKKLFFHQIVFDLTIWNDDIFSILTIRLLP